VGFDPYAIAHTASRKIMANETALRIMVGHRSTKFEFSSTTASVLRGKPPEPHSAPSGAGCIRKVASISPRKVVSEYPQVQILALAERQYFVEVTRFNPLFRYFR
jgi:hypothetical protein